MALQEKVIPIRFTQGINTGDDPKYVSQQLHTLENGYFDKHGSISKRDGIFQFTGSLTHERIGRLQDRPVLYGTPGVAIHNGSSPAGGGFTEINGDTYDGYLYHFDCVSERVYGDGSRVANAEVVEQSNVRTVGYSTYDGTNYRLWLATYNKLTGSLLDRLELSSWHATNDYSELWTASESRGVRLVIEDGTVYAFWANQVTVGGAFDCYSVDVDTSGTIGTPQEVDSSAAPPAGSSYIALDAVVVGTQTILAWHDGAGDIQLVTTANGAVVSTQRYTQSGGTGSTHLCLFELNGDVVLLYDDGTNPIYVNARVFQDDVSATPVTASTVIMQWATSVFEDGPYQLAGIATTTSRFYAYATRNSELAADSSTAVLVPTDVVYNECAVSGGVISLTNAAATYSSATLKNAPDDDGTGADNLILKGIQMMSKPFLEDNGDPAFLCGRAEVGLNAGSNYPTTAVLCRHTIGSDPYDFLQIMGKTLPYEAYHDFNVTGFLPSVRSITNGYQTATCSVPASGFDFSKGVTSSALCVSSFTTNYQLMDWVESSDTCLNLASSCPWEIAGSTIVESGFLCRPRVVVTQPASGDPGDGVAPKLPTGKYGFAAVYEWTDERGRLYRSDPSFVESYTVGTGNGEGIGDVNVSSLHLSNKRPLGGAGEIQIRLYRTTLDGTTYRYVDSKVMDRTAAYTVFQAEYNAVGDGVQLSDLDLAKNEVIYSDPDNLEGGTGLVNEQPNPYRTHCIHQGRHFYVHRDYENAHIFYSHQFIPGFAPEYSNDLRVTVPPDGGRILAMISYLDKLFIFKERRIYATHGNGLDGAGNGTGYATPYLITDSIGLKKVDVTGGLPNSSSLVRTPIGVMFQSDQGILLLDQGLKLRPIGDRVSYFTDQSTYYISSSNVLPGRNLVIFTAADVLGGTDWALVYDYVQDQWSTYSAYECPDAVEAYGVLYMKRSSLVRVENTGSYVDDPGDVQVPLRIVTGWFSFAQPGGYQRIRDMHVLGQYLTAHSLRVRIGYDFDPVWTDSYVYDPELSTTLNAKYADYSAHFGSAQDSTYDDKAYLVEVAGSRQKCTAVRFELSDEDPVAGGTSAQALRLNGIVLSAAFKKGAVRLGSARVQ